MVAPGATGASFDVLLQFALDEEANKRVQARVTTIQEELARIEKQAAKTGQAINTAMQGTDQKATAAEKSVTKLGAELARLGERTKQSSKQTNEALDSNIRKLKQLEETAKRVRQQSALISGAAARGVALSAQGLLAGGAIVGGILAESGRFAKEANDAGKATAATREWAKATEDLARARARVDTVLLRQSLPLLQQAARIAEQAAGFIEKHPEIVRAALNAGLVIAGLSAVGLAVSKGIKLVADITYITATATELLAARIHEKAARDELLAASKGLVTNRADDLRRAFGLSGGAAPAKSAGALGTVALYATAVIIGAELGTALGNKLGELITGGKTGLAGKGNFGIGDVAIGGIMAIQSVNYTVLKGLGDLGLISEKVVDKYRATINELDKFAAGLLGAKKILSVLEASAAQTAAAGGSVGGRSPVLSDATANRMGTETQQALVDAWSKWQADDAKLVSDAADKRLKIIADSEKAIADATQRYGAQRVQINQRFDQQRADLIENYAEELKQAEEDYAKQRADIIRSAGEEIQRIEVDHQEAIRKMTLEHNERVEDLTAARDALGLVKEERRFDRERAESERDINREIAQRRQDTARRLQELAEEYAAERAQRQAQFQEALKENEARRQEELKEAAIAHQQALQQAREQRAQQLRELQEGLNAERLRRREMFIAEVRDLDASLLGERNLKAKYYNLMLADAQAWLINYRRTLAGGATTGTVGGISGTRDSGGYADPGIYRIGQREFVMSNASTRAAERIIGGQLTQQNLLQALSGISARSGTYVDQRRIDRPIGKDEKNMIQQIAMDALRQALGA